MWTLFQQIFISAVLHRLAFLCNLPKIDCTALLNRHSVMNEFYTHKKRLISEVVTISSTWHHYGLNQTKVFHWSKSSLIKGSKWIMNKDVDTLFISFGLKTVIGCIWCNFTQRPNPNARNLVAGRSGAWTEHRSDIASQVGPKIPSISCQPTNAAPPVPRDLAGMSLQWKTAISPWNQTCFILRVCTFWHVWCVCASRSSVHVRR